MHQLQTIEKALSDQAQYIENYEHSPSRNVLLKEIRSSQESFQRMEDKIHEMIIYLCKSITISKYPELKLDNMLGEDDYGEDDYGLE